jgi:hypothetical protein
MSDRSAAAGHRPLPDTARDQFMGNTVTVKLVTWLGARLAIVVAVDRAAQSRRGARG